MSLPAYWWLLALPIIIQGGFFVRFCILRLRGKEVQRLTRPVAGGVYFSGLAGMIYGVVQSDPVFVLGQACLLFIFYRHQQTA